MGVRAGAGQVERRTDEAFEWPESVTGGRIVSKRQQARWRPHWFLEVNTGLWEPIQRTMGFASNHPLTRMDGTIPRTHV